MTNLPARLALPFLLASCVAMKPPPPWKLIAKYSPEEYAPYELPGTGRVEGEAFCRLQNGGVITAAGLQVGLFPATTVGDEWYSVGVKGGREIDYGPDAKSIFRHTRVFVADASGGFEFDGIPTGDYYVSSVIEWRAYGYNSWLGSYTNQQRAVCAQRVHVVDGETLRVVLQPIPAPPPPPTMTTSTAPYQKPPHAASTPSQNAKP